MIDLTLDRLKRPVIPGLVPQFGTTVEVTEKNKGGLSTTEVDSNVALAYELQREVNVSTSDTTSIVEHDAKLALVGDEAITLTLQGASYGGCELKITNRGSQTATILYNEGASIEIPPRGYLRFIWTLQDWWVEQRRNPQEDGGNIQTYTYVVDSDQALIDWANNDRNKGQDYTSVLIKRGTWYSTIGVNLTNAGTKVVVGEADSKLMFNGVEKCIYYEEASTDTGCYMLGVEAMLNTSPHSSDSTHVGIFEACCNLMNCRATITGYLFSSSDYRHCFSNCHNLTNCTGEAKITSYGSPQTFYQCSNLSNCTGIAEGPNYPSVFYECENLANCKGICNVTYRGIAEAFAYCSQLTNCTGKSNGSKYCVSYGFWECLNLTNCTGTGIAIKDSSPPGTGYAFSSCRAVVLCKAGANCTTGVFEECYASNAKTATYACADTANGGFNNTTNPAV